MNYHYPISYDWSKEEVVHVLAFYQCVEKAYEKSILKEDLLLAYKQFKQIVPSKSEEKQLGKEFEKQTGYSCYHVVQKALALNDGEKVKM